MAKLAKEEGNDELVGTLERMRAQAKETEDRGTQVASSFEGKKTAILDEARDVKGKAQEMMKTYLDQASDTLDGFEFLTMAEAGEVGHWEILDTLNKRAANRDVSELVGWALPIQQQHLETVRSASLELAAGENPDEAGGLPLAGPPTSHQSSRWSAPSWRGDQSDATTLTRRSPWRGRVRTGWPRSRTFALPRLRVT